MLLTIAIVKVKAQIIIAKVHFNILLVGFLIRPVFHIRALIRIKDIVRATSCRFWE